MCNRNALAIAFLICAHVVSAQNTDTSYSPQKGWKLGGISIIIGDGPGMTDSKIPALFQNTFSSYMAQNKWTADKSKVAQYKGKTYMGFNFKQDMGLRFTLKPKDTWGGRFKSYQEISLGLMYSTRSASVYYYGDSTVHDSAWRIFMSGYDFEVQNLNFDVNYLLQTPGLLGFISFYTGPGIRAGINLKQKLYAYESDETLYEVGDSNKLIKTQAILYNAHKDFSPLAFSAALYIPIGVKFKVSPRSNIFLEFTYTRQTSFFKNGYTHSQWYKGFYIGYRFKLGLKGERAQYEEKNGPAKAPEPFY